MEKIEEKKKNVASIPANYVSILQLQERWMKEKKGKQKEKDLVERGVKQQVDDGQRKTEDEDVMKEVKAMEPREKGLGFRSSNCKKELKWVEKKELDVTAIVSNKEKDGGDSKKKKKKNKIQGGSMANFVKCEPKVNILVKEKIPRVYTSKGDYAVRDSIVVETQFQDLCIKKRVEEGGRENKGPARLNTKQRGNYRYHRHDQVIRETRTMVWVKKEKNNESGGGNGF